MGVTLSFAGSSPDLKGKKGKARSMDVVLSRSFGGKCKCEDEVKSR